MIRSWGGGACVLVPCSNFLILLDVVVQKLKHGSDGSRYTLSLGLFCGKIDYRLTSDIMWRSHHGFAALGNRQHSLS